MNNKRALFLPVHLLIVSVLSLIFIFSFSFVSSAYIAIDVPDLCAPTNNLSTYNFLTENYVIENLSDTFALKYSFTDHYSDPYFLFYGTGVYPLAFQEDMNLTINLDYGVNDTLYIQTGPYENYFTLNVWNGTYNFANSPTYCDDCQVFDTFDINISDDCPAWNWTPIDEGGGGGGPGGNSSLYKELRAYFSLNETSGTYIDWTGNFTNTVVGGSPNRSYPGILDYSIDLDGVDQYFTPGNLGDFGAKMDDTNQTISVWFKTDSSAGGYLMGIIQPPSSNQNFQIGINKDSNEANLDNSLFFSVRANGGQWHMGGIDHNLSFIDSEWHHLVLTHYPNTNNFSAYFDGSPETVTMSINTTLTTTYDFDGDIYIGGRNVRNSSASYVDVMIDEVGFWDKMLNSTEIASLYNGGVGLTYGDFGNASEGGGSVYPTLIGTIPDVTMNETTGNWTYFNASDYYSDFEEYFLWTPDPYDEDFTYVLCGFDEYCVSATAYYDYFDVLLGDLAQAAVNLYSYDRPYNVTFPMSFCNGGLSGYCLNDSFNLYIDQNLSGVLKIDTLFASYDLGYTYDPEEFSMNALFQYHADTVFTMPDSNYTGILNATFPFNWTYTPGVYEYDVNYTVNYNCTIDQIDYYYVSLGDLNMSMRCGSNQAYYSLAAYNNYNQTVYFNGTNAVNSTWTNTNIISGNGRQVAGYIPSSPGLNDSNFTSTLFNWTDVYDAMPKSDDNSINFWYVIVVLLATVISLFGFFMAFTRSFNATFWLTFLGTWFVGLFFAIGGYLPWTWVIVLPVLGISWVIIKAIFGGSG